MTDALNDISAADWGKGIALSILASLIGGASKLAIRKSWLIVVENDDEDDDQDEPEPENGFHDETSPPQALSLDTASVTSSEENYPVYTQGQDDSRRWKWWAPLVLRYSGMLGMSVLNPVCCVLAMNYASPSILAPFSGLTLVWVILLAQAVVGEKPSSAQVTACCLIIVGEVIVAVFGDHTNNVDQSADDVRNSYKEPAFLAFFAVLGVYIVLLCYLINFSKSPVLRRFAWGSCGGSLTGMQNFLKDSLTLFNNASGSSSDSWMLPFFFTMAGASAFTGLLVLTACMKRYDATYSAASFVGSFVVSASLMSAVHYHTFQELDNLVNFILYPVGLLVLVVGVYILVRESHEPDEMQMEGDDEEVVPIRKDSDDSQIPFMYTQVEDDGETDENPPV